MTATTQLQCACGQTRLEITGTPIASVECCCTSCREAAARMQKLEGAPKILTDYSTTPFVMVRKDRVRFLAGQENLKIFRLTPKASTHRALATCCNTPMYLNFQNGHWLSIYTETWPKGAVPPPTLRTMAADLSDDVKLPDDIPNLNSHNLKFFAKLLGAWMAMGFRRPQMPATEEINI